MSLQNKFLKEKAYIDGAWVSADSKERYKVRNPADGSELGSVPSMGGEETIRAIDAAERALPLWSGKSAKERSIILRRWYDLIMENANQLAALMTLEQGKPLAEAQGEIKYAAAFVEWYAEEAKRVYGDVIPSPIANSRIVVTKQPVGVCGVITPWNFPSAMITRKAAPALAAGCTVVCKPAGQTPFSALALAVLAEEAGIPPGVINIVTGKDPIPISRELCKANRVRKISFTGSTEVGRILYRQCSHNIKKLSLELGGHAPFIVFPDADIEAAVEGAMIAKYRNAGQTCVCANRFYIHEDVYEQFAGAFIGKVSQLRVGPGLDPSNNIGPMINSGAIEKVREHIHDAKNKGGKVPIGGALQEKKSLFFQPTVITDATEDMLIATEETFGPVAPLFKFKDEDDVIRRANNTEFGLAAYFYARDVGRIWRVSEALEYGMVVANAGVLSTEVAPFGGIKQSGIGREGGYYGLDEYLNIKYTLMAGI